MHDFPLKLQNKLEERKSRDSFRELEISNGLIDFSSNDYLGFAKNEKLYANTFQCLLNKGVTQNGASGSRLLSGNHVIYKELEEKLTAVHQVESALVFNSGYDANIGFFSTVPQRNDIVFYDESIHASIRDGIKMGLANRYKFKHNDLVDLKLGIERILPANRQGRNLKDSEIYVVTESVFSMDGDSPDLKKLTRLCKTVGAHLIVDEAHAIGVLGVNGIGLVQELGLQKQLFARIVTFGKALGGHGAAILGSIELKNYLINFARSFIYTTGLPPHTVANAVSAYAFLKSEEGQKEQDILKDNICLFKSKLETLGLKKLFIPSNSAIHSCLVSGNEKVRSVSKKLADQGFSVKPILAPTVPEGKERLRFCLHSFNSSEEIGLVIQMLKRYLK
jgi:8-amino-7-oxononanoate synthase